MFTLSKLFATMHYKKRQMVSSFHGGKLTTSPVLGTKKICLQLKSVVISLMHT